MTNMYQPQGGDPPENHPTEPFWLASGAPPGQRGSHPAGGPAGPAPGWPQPVRQTGHAGNDRRKGLRLTYVIAAVALLAAAGVAGAMSLASHSSPAAPQDSGAAAGPAGQAAFLSATLNAADSPGPLRAGTPSAVPNHRAAGPAAHHRAHPCAQARKTARAARRAGRPKAARAALARAGHCHAIRRRVFRFFLLRGVEGQFTFLGRHGLKTLAFERGVVASVAPGVSLVVKATDGTTWIWHFVAATVVRDRAGKLSLSAISTGEPVWVGGPVAAGVKDARLIVVRPPGLAGAPAPSTPGR